MARFYASISGRGKELTREGTAASGVEGHLRGWNVGAKVYLSVDSQDQDVVTVYLTGGSNGNTSDFFLGRFTLADLERLHLERLEDNFERYSDIRYEND